MESVLLVQSLTLDPERGGGRRSDHVGVSEHMLVARLELLRPVNDDRFEESTTAELEEWHQVPHHAQTMNTQSEQSDSADQQHKVWV